MPQRFKVFWEYHELTYHLKLQECEQERTEVRERTCKLRMLRTHKTSLGRANLDQLNNI